MPKAICPLFCQVCKHRWNWEHELPMSVEVWARLMRAHVVCPECGNNSKEKETGVLIDVGLQALEAADA